MFHLQNKVFVAFQMTLWQSLLSGVWFQTGFVLDPRLAQEWIVVFFTICRYFLSVWSVSRNEALLCISETQTKG